MIATISLGERLLYSDNRYVFSPSDSLFISSKFEAISAHED